MKAKQRNRPVTMQDIHRLSEACGQLRAARLNMRLAGANNSRAYIARAIKSAQGALNSAHRMLAKQERAKVAP